MFARAVAGAFVVFCLGYLVLALGFSFGSMSAPKSGFVPTIAGTCGLVLASINFINVMRREQPTTELRAGIRRVGLFLLGLLGIVVLMETAGFFVAVLLGTGYLLVISGVKGWVVPVVVSIALAGGLYVIFERLLLVSLP